VLGGGLVTDLDHDPELEQLLREIAEQTCSHGHYGEIRHSVSQGKAYKPCRACAREGYRARRAREGFEPRRRRDITTPDPGPKPRQKTRTEPPLLNGAIVPENLLPIRQRRRARHPPQYRQGRNGDPEFWPDTVTLEQYRLIRGL
jgi:hypothetical protein